MGALQFLLTKAYMSSVHIYIWKTVAIDSCLTVALKQDFKDEQNSHLHVIMIDNAKLKDTNMLNENRNLEVNRGWKIWFERFLAFYLIKGGERLPSYILV